MALIGANFIGFHTSKNGDSSFHAFDPFKDEYLPEAFYFATQEELESALYYADKSFLVFKEILPHQRAIFLETIAEEIMSLGDNLLQRCVAETGLPELRIKNERTRTINQIFMFSELLKEGWWVDARINTGNTELQKPDVRRMLQPIGPVAIFGASNFPLAFSTAGGDTISALASGCPVILKAHPSHPGTNEMMATAIIKAAQRASMPEGVFSSLFLSNELSMYLVQHSKIKAVGFTGSRTAGMILYNAACQRQEPIPVYAEMSSINPVILLKNALMKNAKAIATGLAASVTLGFGQFCTNPGLVILIQSKETNIFLKMFSDELIKTTPGTMLNKKILQSYKESIESLINNPEVKLLATGNQEPDEKHGEVKAFAFTVTGKNFLKKKQLSEEIFGPCTLFILCQDAIMLEEVICSLKGQLTATLHATKEDNPIALKVINILTQKAGRVIYGGFPTGVEVCDAMHHGGPFPSTTDAKFTSVGTAAINRFIRPIAFQNFPEDLLPEALKDNNPLNIHRLLNGEWQR